MLKFARNKLSRDPNESSTHEIPEPDPRDKLHKLITTIVSPIPYASELISEIVKPPFEKRINEWRQAVDDGLRKLEQQTEDFKIEELADNETFVTAVLQITPIAISTHVKEKHEYLPNAILNSALPTVPADDMQQIFVQLLGQFTVAHIKTLKVFRRSDIPALNLNNSEWKINISRGKWLLQSLCSDNRISLFKWANRK